jgi:uncharacterized protein YciI
LEYFFYCRDKPGTGTLRERLVEAHWSFMDAYADRMIARGPTLADDGGAGPSGSPPSHSAACKDAESASSADVAACGMDHAEKLRGFVLGTRPSFPRGAEGSPPTRTVARCVAHRVSARRFYVVKGSADISLRRR